jgi:hypothetical protein
MGDMGSLGLMGNSVKLLYSLLSTLYTLLISFTCSKWPILAYLVYM